MMIKISYDAKKHCVKLTHGKATYSFYSDIIYGIDTKSNMYRLLKNEWYYNTKDGKLQVRYAGKTFVFTKGKER